MSLFLDSIGIWIALTFVVGVVGYFVYQNDPRGKTLGIAVGVTLIVLAVGLACYFGIDTDRKSISRMLNTLASRLEQDDLDGVLNCVSSKAMGTRGKARTYMGMFILNDVRFRNLKFEVNQLTSPPIAQVSFLAVVYWRTRNPIDGFSFETPQFQAVKFDIELEKANRSWLVTDKCDFDYRGQQ